LIPPLQDESHSVTMNIAQANEALGIPGVLSIRGGAGDLPLIDVHNPFAIAQISAYAGQVLAYRPIDETLAIWPHPFSLTLEVTIGATLDLALISHNPDDQPLTLTQALHTYFKVGDIRRAQVLGLAGYDYIDKVSEEGGRGTQSGPVNFDGPVNRIYLDTEDDLIIDDPVLGRRIHIEREGSRSAVVWTPWIEQSRTMADFGDEEYLGMVCVETTNAASDAVTIAPGASYRLGTRYAIQRD